jgi:AraC-like DNA-binding protein
LGFFLLEGRVTQQMRALGDEIIGCVMGGAMRRVFMEYKALELLYMQLRLLDSSIAQRACVSPAEYETAARINAYFDANLAKTPRLAELTKKSGMAHTRLNKVFNLLYGDTVFGVLRRKRLDHARSQLQVGHKNISEIAYDCGFSSPSHFTKAFVRHFGLPPKRYQLECLNTMPTAAFNKR